MTLFGGGLLLCIGILVALNWGEEPEEKAASTGADIPNLMAMPPVDKEQLATVKDSTAAERVIIEPQPFQGLASLAVGLFGGHLLRLGEPDFPFDEGEARAAELRGEPFRMRGRVLDAEVRERVTGKAPEFWCLIETDRGDRAWFASLTVPETLFGSQNYVLADGYFFKYYTQKMGEERLTAPLFVGRSLVASYPVVGPAESPDVTVLAEVKDPALGAEVPLDERGLWHLLNVARTVRAEDGGVERAFADARKMEDAVLEDLARAPEVYRGAPFVFGGMVKGRPGFELLGENPLRMERMSTAWLRNNSSGVDTLVQVCAPGEFDFLDPPGTVLFHGWFLQLYSYEDKEGNQRRAPVFVIAKMEGVKGQPDPWAGQVIWVFIGLSLVLGGVMMALVRRDKRRASEFDAQRREKRKRRAE